jgi:hypothetical protein
VTLEHNKGCIWISVATLRCPNVSVIKNI